MPRFVDQLRAWTIAELRRRNAGRSTLADEVRRLIDYPYVGDPVTPSDRGDIPGRLGAIVRATPIDPDFVPPPGSFIYYPLSDDAQYGWGDPYLPGNAPLGTVLAGYACGGPNYSVDGTKHPYRLYDKDGDPDKVTHGTTLQAGRRYWKYDDYVISWNPPIGIENRGSTRAIYRNGGVLAYTSSGFPAAAAIRKIGSAVYLYVLIHSLPSSPPRLDRAVVNPVGADQSLTWATSTGLPTAIGDVSSPSYNNAIQPVTAAFNKSCTELIITQPGRVTTFDITTWNSESLTDDTYYWDSYEWLYGDPAPDSTDATAADVETPVLSGYVANSDTRRDMTVKVEMRGAANGLQYVGVGSTYTAYFRVDGVTIRMVRLHDSVKEGELYYQKDTFPCALPWFQDVQSGIYTVDVHRFPRQGDGYCTRWVDYEVYRGTKKVENKTLTEEHPGTCDPDVWQNNDFSEFMAANNVVQRDPFLGDVEERNFSMSYTYRLAGINPEACMRFIAQEVIGCLFNDPVTTAHDLREVRPVAWGQWIPDQSTSQSFIPHHYFGFAANWDGAYFISRRLFSGWSSVQNPVYEWWNPSSVDFVTETEMTGTDPRFVARPCFLQANGPPYPQNQHIGVYHTSTENPFAVEQDSAPLPMIVAQEE